MDESDLFENMLAKLLNCLQVYVNLIPGERGSKRERQRQADRQMDRQRGALKTFAIKIGAYALVPLTVPVLHWNNFI